MKFWILSMLILFPKTSNTTSDFYSGNLICFGDVTQGLEGVQ